MFCRLRPHCSCLLDVEAVWRTERDLECTKNESVRLNTPKNVSGEKAKQEGGIPPQRSELVGDTTSEICLCADHLPFLFPFVILRGLLATHHLSTSTSH
jgi:hypothetical protein